MNDQNEMITKKIFHEGIDQLEARITANTDRKIDALALMTQQEFAEMRGEARAVEEKLMGVEGKLAGVEKRLICVEETMATKQDLFRFETRVMGAISEIIAEIRGHNTRILALEQIVKP